MPDGMDKAYYEAMSPTMLAAQPVDDVANDLAAGKDWDVIFAQLESRLSGLRSWRYTWWAHWSSLAASILPSRFHWLVTANTMNRGRPINEEIVDSTTTLAMQVCAAGMWTGLTSPSRPWFELGIGLPWVQLDQEGAEWLNDTQQRLYVVLGQSNFYTIMAQAFKDVSTFGTAPVIMYEDAEDVLRCYLPCAGEYYLAVGSRLTVDTLYREFNLTISDIVEMFGADNCPASVRELWNTGGGSLEIEKTVCHAIEPNFAMTKRGGKEIRVVPGSFTYREVYWLKGQKTERELSRRGFNEKPFFTARWSVTSNDAYGRSPGMDCLGDTKQLQMETRRKAEFIEKLVRPPMGADITMKNEPASINPGHITYTSSESGKKGFWPLFEVSPAALPPMVEDIKEIQARIQRCFFVDIFMAISNMEGVQPRNELELTKRDLERLQQLGPFIALFEAECASPAILRAMGILQRRGLLKPMPKSLHGLPLKINYTSMLKQAQLASETASMEQMFRIMGELSQAAQAAGEPNPLRLINLDQATRTYGDKISFPANCLYPADVVAQMDQQRTAKQQQAALQASTLPAVQAAQGLSKTNVGGGRNALEAMLGTGSAQ